jgi:hypothetical protein
MGSEVRFRLLSCACEKAIRTARGVKVEYAATSNVGTGLLRGMEFQ